jgi:hypothetical protein
MLGMNKRVVAAFVGLVASFAATALAVKEDLLEKARALAIEAKPLVETANDTDLPMEQRRGPRKQAFTKLKQAREFFDAYLDANPSMEEKLDKEYTEIVASIFWLKKDSGLGELEKDDKPEAPAPATPPAAPPPDAAGGAKPAPAPPSLGPEPPAPKGEAPSDFAFRAKTKLAAISAYEKAHPGDLPYLKNCYEQFLADFSDPSLPEYATAVEKLGKVNDRLKTVLKEVAKRDPDTIKTDDSKAEKTIFGRLTSDFGSKDVETRRRAARLMAAARVRSAAHFLARGLFDKDAEVAKTCRDGLVAVGGRFVGEKLVEFYRDAPKERQQGAFDVLAEITRKGPVDAAAQAPFIGRFVLSNEPDIAMQSIVLLRNLGRVGGPGLMCGLDSKIFEKKIETMKALADARYYKSATTIADRYLCTRGPPSLRTAALEALEQMGKPAIPYMVDQITGDSGPYVAMLLTKMTGEPFILGDARHVQRWCEQHKSECEDK